MPCPRSATRPLHVLVVALALVVAGSAGAAESSRAEIDIGEAQAPPAAAMARLERLRSDPALTRVGTVAHVDERHGVPNMVVAPAGTARAANGRAVAVASAAAAARSHLLALAPYYRLDAADVAGASLRDVHDTGDGGIIAVFDQAIDGVPVFREEMKVQMDRGLGLLAVTGHVPGREDAGPAEARAFTTTPNQAIARAVGDLAGAAIDHREIHRTGDTEGGYQMFAASLGPVTAPIRARRVLFHLADRLVPAYYIELLTAEDGMAYVVAADDGRVLFRHDLVAHDTFTYRVWADNTALHAPYDGPYGNAPSPHPTGSPNLYSPPFVSTALVSVPYGPISTGDPWLAPGATTTTGNNVDAYADLVAPDGYTAGDLRPTTTSANTFDRTYDPNAAPGASSTQRLASATQAFYVNNFLHDWFYDSGFNEAAGNAQLSNFGRGGYGNDRLRVEVQDYLKTNNADMYTPADGASPRAQFYPWSPPGPAGVTQVTVNAPASIAGNKAAVGASTNAMTIDLTAPVALPNPGTFSVTLTSPHQTAPGVEWVHIADVDGDGKKDLVFACFGDNSIRVERNNGSGFDLPAIYPNAAGPYTVITADLNNDGKPDLVTANFTASNASVRLGTGGGAFGARTEFTTGTNAACVAVGRFNADAFDDIVVANYGSSSVSVLLGNGAGGFAPKADYTMGANPNWVAVGDLNNDGKADIVTANAGSNTVSVRLGLGTGAFDTHFISTCGSNPLTLALGDVNNDGRLDVVTANSGANTVAACLGQGNGFFTLTTTRAVPSSPVTVTLGQMNGDGLLDAVVCSDAANSFSVLAGNGAGGLAAPVSFPTGMTPYGVQVGDVTGDGYPDVVTAEYNQNALTVHQGNPAAALPSCPPFTNTLTGCIALIDGANSCDAYTKIHAAELAGAVGVILTAGTGAPLTVSPAVGIPAFQVTSVDGNPIWGALRQGAANATLTQHTYVVRDAALDNAIAAHEWAHHMSNRLVGNAVGLTNTQGGGMGEGWSDFTALLMTVKPEDAAASANANWAGVFPSATYVMSNSAGATDAFYFGLRRYPYSTDLTKNPLTFKHIQDSAFLPNGIPVNDNVFVNSEVHNTGEVWCSALWECYAALLRATGRLTFDQARDRMRQYLVASLKLTPVTPTFLEARDALLLAANANDPADAAAFRTAFAKRGMGSGAVAPGRDATDNNGVIESFAVGGDLQFVSAVMTDEIHSCDLDLYLDSGEDALLTVTLVNPISSNATLSATTATVSSSNPNVTFPQGATMSFPASQPGGGTTKATLRVHGAGSGLQQQGFTIQYNDPGFARPGPRSASLQQWGNADEVASQSDNVEERTPTWSFGGPALSKASLAWSRAELTAYSHAFYVPDPDSLSDRSLVSPPIAVGPGAFGFTFKHRFSFQGAVGFGSWDGGVVEISTDGGANWTDIGASISPGYNGTIDPGYNNPLAGRPGFVIKSSSYPNFVTASASLGTTYANQTVRIRFRLGADWGGSGFPGWWIDDLAFSGITNLPFVTLVAEPGTCPTVGVDEPLPAELALAVAGANPAIGSPVMRFALPERSRVTLGVYDLSGRHVATLVDGELPAGVHSARWERAGAGPGVYFVRMAADGRSLARRVVLMGR